MSSKTGQTNYEWLFEQPTEELTLGLVIRHASIWSEDPSTQLEQLYIVLGLLVPTM